MAGKDAKWAKWGSSATTGAAATVKKSEAKAAASQAPETAAAAAAARETGHATVIFDAVPASGSVGEGGGGALAVSRPSAVTAATTPGATQGEGSVVEGTASLRLEDLIVALQQDPAYSRSTLLFRLLNEMP